MKKRPAIRGGTGVEAESVLSPNTYGGNAKEARFLISLRECDFALIFNFHTLSHFTSPVLDKLINLVMIMDKNWFVPGPSLMATLERLCDTPDRKAVIERLKKLFPDETRKW